jgi:mannose-6-phosphate isomerase
VSSSISSLVDRLQRDAARGPAAAPPESPALSLGDKERLVLRLNEQRPGDVGVLASFFLNHVSDDLSLSIFYQASPSHIITSLSLVGSGTS